MRNRLSKIISPKDGRTLMLAVDHGYFLGPTTGLEKFKEYVEPLLPYADTLFATRGMIRNSINPDIKTPIMLRNSGGTSILNKELLHEGITVDIEDVIRMNAVGVGYSITVGMPWERDTILDFSKVVDACERYGLIAMAVTAVGRELKKDARYIGLATRMAAEHGAHIVKTYYCDGFERIVDACPVPIVMAGGKKIAEIDALTMAYNAIQAGAAGVDMGRNIFQSDDPVAMIRAVRELIHNNATPKEALQFFKENRKVSSKKKSGIASDDRKKV